MKLQEYSLSKIWEVVLQLRGIRTFCLVGSLEVNMKILVLNCISARNFHLFLLIIQISEQPPQSADFPYYFSYLFLLLPLCRQFTQPIPLQCLMHNKKVLKKVLKTYSLDSMSKDKARSDCYYRDNTVLQLAKCL